jgi:succinyl-diaminopimelate desuccinylase
MKKKKLAQVMAILVFFLLPALTVVPSGEPERDLKSDQDIITEEELFTELSKWVEIKTYRGSDLTEEQVRKNLEALRDQVNAMAVEFNATQTNLKFEKFEWSTPNPDYKEGSGNPKKFWVFGFTLGTGKRKIALCTHMDTVPPGLESDWTTDPFVLTRANEDYNGENQPFFMGRGAIDDKGPGVIAFHVLKAIAKKYDGRGIPNDITIQLIYDTSEETEMSVGKYLDANPDQKPELGVIYDASWTVRAEKGIERPVFTVSSSNQLTPEGLWIETLNTPKGPTNQIPDQATAIIKSNSLSKLVTFANTVADTYKNFQFDDPNYQRAEMKISKLDPENQTVTLTTYVSGAQHGSAPDSNRKNGANPLVSLTNFLGGLVQQNVLELNEISFMCKFIKWTWGTMVFGETHPEQLNRNDDIFMEGNGTTYALTRLYTDPCNFPTGTPAGKKAWLGLDIRYAIGHNSYPWDHETEGLLPGTSIFQEKFEKLVDEFNDQKPMKIEFTTKTVETPDIRLVTGASFEKISRAYEQVMGEKTVAYAIGGGTDAKGKNNFIAAGALFTNEMGPPINYHGIDEGAPVNDLLAGAKILYRLLENEINDNSFWAKSYSYGEGSHAFSIQPTKDGGYIVAGYIKSGSGDDYWVMKLNKDGSIDWQKTYGGNKDDWAYSIQETNDGGYIVAGYTHSFSSGDRDCWVLKLREDGTIKWQKTYGGKGYDCAYSIQETSDGGYIFAGTFGNIEYWVTKLNKDGVIEWQKTYGELGDDEAYSIQETKDGGYIIAGYTSYFSNRDYWIIKLKKDGSIDWQKAYDGGYEECAYSIQALEDGGYIVAGGPMIPNDEIDDYWVLKLKEDGAIEWQKNYGGKGYDCAYSIQETENGGYIVAGSTYNSGNDDSCVIKLKEDGDIEWQKTYAAKILSIQKTEYGGYITAGNLVSSLFIMKLKGDGTCPPLGIDTHVVPQDTFTILEITDITGKNTDAIVRETNVMPKDTDAKIKQNAP